MVNAVAHFRQLQSRIAGMFATISISSERPSGQTMTAGAATAGDPKTAIAQIVYLLHAALFRLFKLTVASTRLTVDTVRPLAVVDTGTKSHWKPHRRRICRGKDSVLHSSSPWLSS